jgi:hypothetical protein
MKPQNTQLATAQPGEQCLTLRFVTDADGEPVSVVKKNGFDLSATVELDSTGTYIAHLGSAAPTDGFCGGFGSIEQAAGYDEEAACAVRVVAYDAAEMTVTFVTVDGVGVVTDPAEDDAVTVKLFFNTYTINTVT